MTGVGHTPPASSRKPHGLKHPILNATRYGLRMGDFGPKTVPEEHVLMGDNRDHSADSRVWGMVPFRNIKGKARFVWLNTTSVSRVSRCSATFAVTVSGPTSSEASSALVEDGIPCRAGSTDDLMVIVSGDSFTSCRSVTRTSRRACSCHISLAASSLSCLSSCRNWLTQHQELGITGHDGDERRTSMAHLAEVVAGLELTEDLSALPDDHLALLDHEALSSMVTSSKKAPAGTCDRHLTDLHQLSVGAELEETDVAQDLHSSNGGDSSTDPVAFGR